MDWTLIFFTCFIGGVLAVKPNLRPSSETVEKSQNESYVVMCNANTDDVTWSGPNGRPIPLDKGRVHVENKDGLGQILFFDRIEVSDRGRYDCTSKSKETSSFILTVFKMPQFINTPKVHSVNEFNPAIIRCEVEGEPKPLISWQKDGHSLDGISDKRYIPEPKGLKILNATKTDSGVYTCRALQGGRDGNFIQSVHIVLKVQHKPEWKDPVEGSTLVYGYITGETNLSCDALAEPQANYTWLRDNREVKSLRLNATEILEADRSVLKIIVQDDKVFGTYQCTAKNKLGSISKKFELQKGEKPPAPSGFRVLSTTVHTATLNIASDVKDGDLVGYRVQFVISRPGQEFTWDHPNYQDLTKKESGHFELVDLLEDTPYTLRVASRSVAGLSDYTNETTLIRTQRTGEITSSSGRLSLLAAMMFLPLSTMIFNL